MHPIAKTPPSESRWEKMHGEENARPLKDCGVAAVAELEYLKPGCTQGSQTVKLSHVAV
jgi:hypothetical protein